MVIYLVQVPVMLFSLPARRKTVNLPALITRVVVPTTLVFFPLHSRFFLPIIFQTSAKIMDRKLLDKDGILCLY